MCRWIDVGAISDLKFEPGTAVKVEGTWIGLFRLGEGYAAIDNLCPHAGAPLCDGTRMGDTIVCALHCWEFDLATGACEVGAEWNVRRYAVREANGRLQIEWPATA